MLCPKFGPAVGHVYGHMIVLHATILGFKVEGSLDEVRAAGFSEEAVAQCEIM